MIPIVVEPHSDELLYSWICRLGDMNGLNPLVLWHMYFKEDDKTNTMPCDLRKCFSKFYSNLKTDASISDLYLQTSTFPYEAIAMIPAQQTRYVNNAFYPADALNPAINSSFKQLRFCPDCVEEDIAVYGRPYFHRKHHLSGICRCYQHGTKLRAFSGTRNKLSVETIDNYPKVEGEGVSLELAKFGCHLLDANIRTDQDAVRKAIRASNLYDEDMTKIILKSQYISTGDILELLCKLCDGDVEALRSKIEVETKCDELPTDYEYVNSSGVLDTYRHETCSTVFSTTSFGYKQGWRCPICSQTKSVQERCDELIHNTANGGYSLITSFASMDAKALFKHNTCGRITKMSVRNFLFEGNRCICERTITFEQAKERIATLGNYELLEYSGTDYSAKIRCNDCGHVFETQYRKFINFPSCRVCEPGVMTPEIFKERVRLLGNDEYEVLSDYTKPKAKVLMKHKLCGREQLYNPSLFLDGSQRCWCSTAYGKAWYEMYELLCEYKQEYGNTNIEKRGYYKDKSLGRWCLGQRQDYKNGELNLVSIQLLNDLGFVWNPLEEEWNRRFEQYKRYCSQTGSCEIARRTIFENEKMGVWVDLQKRLFRQGKLLEARRAQLAEVDEYFFSSLDEHL